MQRHGSILPRPGTQLAEGGAEPSAKRPLGVGSSYAK